VEEESAVRGDFGGGVGEAEADLAGIGAGRKVVFGFEAGSGGRPEEVDAGVKRTGREAGVGLGVGGGIAVQVMDRALGLGAGGEGGVGGRIDEEEFEVAGAVVEGGAIGVKLCIKSGVYGAPTAVLWIEDDGEERAGGVGRGEGGGEERNEEQTQHARIIGAGGAGGERVGED